MMECFFGAKVQKYFINSVDIQSFFVILHSNFKIMDLEKLHKKAAKRKNSFVEKLRSGEFVIRLL